jgi:hypothetical protein
VISTTYDQGAKRFVSLCEMKPSALIAFVFGAREAIVRITPQKLRKGGVKPLK